MSFKALMTAAATGALLIGAGAAYAKSDSVRAMELAEARHYMPATHTQLDALADAPDYYAVAPAATLDSANSPDYYATVAEPAEFYASIAPQTSTQLAFSDDSQIEAEAFESPIADASATVNYPASIEADAAVVAPLADAAAVTPMPTLEVVSSMPVPDTPQNRARYGGPMSRAGRLTAPAGN